MPPDRQTLMRIYCRMHRHFGHRAWWPGETPLEVCVGAILTQNTAWGNVERAIERLKRRGLLSLEALECEPADSLAEAIRPSGYFNVKAARLKSFVAAVRRFGAGEDALAKMLAEPAGPLRERLLAVKGIGPETADSILLYAAGRARFVVDAYTMRIGRRHGLFDRSADYGRVQAIFETALGDDAELFNDFHAQIVETGKTFCRPRARCAGCPLEDLPHDAEL
jgi:endonuclease-3 related protein